MKKRLFFIAILLMIATFFLLMMALSDAQETKRKTVRWGSSKAGSAGYVVLFGVAKVINDRAPELYIEAVPTGGSIASQRMMAKGELDGAYSGTWNLLDMYMNRGPYEKSPYPPQAIKPYQTWYSYLTKQFVITKSDRADIKNWRDLVGKKVCVPLPGASIFEVPKAAFSAMGIWDKIKVVDLAFTAIPDALNMGTIDAVVGYANGDVLIPWMAEVDSRCKIKVVNPTPEDQKIVKKVPGYITASMETKKVFSQDVGVAQAFTIADHYGFHIGRNLSLAHGYKLFKILIENAKEIEKIHAMMIDYARDPLGMQVRAIGSIPNIPVHPGVAKYLKEKGLWQKEWIVGEE
ncbi:MAG: TAXI family TRAP transporter solute-binding subunit [Thermodesulfobacteriota bacterium]